MGSPLRSAATVLFVGAVLAVGATHARFLVLDDRVPRDLCLCLDQVPSVTRILDGRAPGGLPELLDVLTRPSGWWNLAHGVLLAAFGTSPDAFGALDLLAVTASVALAGLVAGQIAARAGADGRVGAAVGALLAAGMPGLVVQARQSWIHVPETALALAGLSAWLADPGLERRRTPLALALAGAAAFALRPSGLVWAGPLALPLLGVALTRPAARPRVAAVAVAWAVALAVPLRMLPEYLSSKAEARARYEALVPEIASQLAMVFGPAPLAVLALAVPVGLFALARRRPGGAAAAGLGVLAGWVALALLLGLVFRAGLDNHVAALAAAAALAGWALAAALPRLGLSLAAVAFLVQLGPQWLGTPPPGHWWWRLPPDLVPPIAPAVLNFTTPFGHYGEDEVAALVDAVCGPKDGCRIAVTEGLYTPRGEEAGALEVFLTGLDRVELLTVRRLDPARAGEIDALVEYACPDPDRQLALRWPETTQIRDALVARDTLTAVWATEIAPACLVKWLTPGGAVADRSALPALPGGGPPPGGPGGPGFPGPPPPGTPPPRR